MCLGKRKCAQVNEICARSNKNIFVKLDSTRLDFPRTAGTQLDLTRLKFPGLESVELSRVPRPPPGQILVPLKNEFR